MENDKQSSEASQKQDSKASQKQSSNASQKQASKAAQNENSQSQKPINLIVDGFRFNTPSDAKAAGDELKKINYIQSHLNYNDPKNVLAIYDKMIENRIFVTPVGLTYVKKVQDFLYNSKEIYDDQVRPLPLSNVYTLGQASAVRDRPIRRIEPVKKRDKLQSSLFISRAINILLVICIAALIIIAMNSQNPNIINYEHVIQDRYASWEQELNARETAVRQRERALDNR